uniref:Uncharacterized protein n=1 Tax=Molossus molossus TaxID=27622 RepID=A0A7J8C8I9_MOLMO|nr:hypothetical protein HJG59_009851 [Molossus molossus]
MKCFHLHRSLSPPKACIQPTPSPPTDPLQGHHPLIPSQSALVPRMPTGASPQTLWGTLHLTLHDPCSRNDPFRPCGMRSGRPGSVPADAVGGGTGPLGPSGSKPQEDRRCSRESRSPETQSQRKGSKSF